MAINPIRIARNNDNYISQAALAKKIGVSRPFIVRAEQGCYVEPGTSLTHYCAKLLNLSPNKVVAKYKDFQRSQRIETLTNKFHDVKKLGGPIAAPMELDDEGKKIIFNHQLFMEWREGYWNTVTAFSTDMCVHPYSVAHYEDGDMYGMPDQLREVMIETGLLLPSFLHDKRWYYAAA